MYFWTKDLALYLLLTHNCSITFQLRTGNVKYESFNSLIAKDAKLLQAPKGVIDSMTVGHLVVVAQWRRVHPQCT